MGLCWNFETCKIGLDFLKNYRNQNKCWISLHIIYCKYDIPMLVIHVLICNKDDKEHLFLFIEYWWLNYVSCLIDTCIFSKNDSSDSFVF